MADFYALQRAMKSYNLAVTQRLFAEYVNDPLPTSPRQEGVIVDPLEALAHIEIGDDLSLSLCYWRADQELASTPPMTPLALRVLAVHLLHRADVFESGKESALT